MRILKITFPLLAIMLFWSFTIQKNPTSQRSINAIKKHSVRLKKEFEQKDLTFGNPIFMRIFKEQNQLEIWVKKGTTFSKFKTYEICYFSGELGPKKQEGDGQSPEGFYFVKPYRMNPWSDYHLSFNIGYPNKYDRENGRTGNYLMVHGSCVSIGCYAMTNPVIEEIWTIISKSFEQGQPFFRIHSFPFPLTEEKLEGVKSNENYPFWKNLQEGYSLFEKSRIPPNVEVINKKYTFD